MKVQVIWTIWIVGKTITTLVVAVELDTFFFSFSLTRSHSFVLSSVQCPPVEWLRASLPFSVNREWIEHNLRRNEDEKSASKIESYARTHSAHSTHSAHPKHFLPWWLVFVRILLSRHSHRGQLKLYRSPCCSMFMQWNMRPIALSGTQQSTMEWPTKLIE